MKKKLSQLFSLMKLNYCLIFDRCFACGAKKNGRLLFCSVICAMSSVKDGLTGK